MRSRKSALIRLYATRTLILGLLAIVTFFFARGAFRMYGRYNEASVARGAVEAEVRDLKDREMDLSKMTKHLSTDRGVEAELRRRYGVAKAGEGVIDIVPATNTAPMETPKRGVIDWIKHLF